MLALSIEHGTDIFERAAPLWPAMWAAAALEPAVDAYWQRVSTVRREGIGRLIAEGGRARRLRTTIDIEQGTDIFVVLVGHEDLPRTRPTCTVDPSAVQGVAVQATASHQLIAHPAPRSTTKGLSFDVLVSPKADGHWPAGFVPGESESGASVDNRLAPATARTPPRPPPDQPESRIDLVAAHPQRDQRARSYGRFLSQRPVTWSNTSGAGQPV